MANAPDPPAAADGAPSGVSPTELGARLAASRESAGISVETVAARTRIRASLIRSMESGDFAPCGGAVYARGHLRSIAHVVQADDAELVAAYDRMAGKPPPAAATVLPQPPAPASAAVPFAVVAARPLPTPVQITGTAEPPQHRPAERRATGSSPGRTLVTPRSFDLRERRGSSMMLAAVAVVALVVVVAAVALARGGSGPSKSGVTATAPTTGATGVKTTPASAPASPATATTLAAAGGVNVTVSVAGNASWVHAVDSTGAVVFQGVIAPGSAKSLHAAQQLSFVFGYAPAVSLLVNGHDIGHPPTNGGGDVGRAVFDATSGG